MIVYIADRKMNILGIASTGLPDGLVIVDDNKNEDIDSGVSSFECRIAFNGSTRKQIAEMCAAGNYLLRSNGNDNGFYTIIDTEIDTKKQEAYLYAEDAGLDLLNEICVPYEADKAYTIDYYINKFAFDSGFEVGINEVSNLSRKLSWEGESTAAERIASVATQFDNAEISYSFKIDGMRVTKKYINIYKKRGSDTGVQLRLNKEVDRIIEKKSIANLATALKVSGGTPEPTEENMEPKPITLDGYEYDDGDFFLDGTYLKSRKAHAVWTRYLAESGNYTGYIMKTFAYATLDQEELCNRAITELKKIREPEVNYEASILVYPESIHIGDRVDIIDDAGGLYVSSRLLKLDESVTKGSKTATLGDFLMKDDGISESILALSGQFQKVAQDNLKAIASAQAAQKNAEIAKDVAESVDGKATTALNAANEAKNSVESAVNAAGEASGKAEAVRQDLEQAQNDIAGFKNGLEAIEETMSAEYTRKTELTEVTADLESKITKSAAEITTSVSATYATKTDLNKKEDGYSIEIYNGTGGNPKPVKFATVNYSSCDSENGVAIKISMVSGHGNGTSYSFLQDATIRVNHVGGVEVDNVKHYGAETPTYDGEIRQYGDIFWVIDTTSKVVDFYCLMGQYARVYQTPWKRLTYSTGGTVTQYTTCTVYSSGDKVWANNSDIALMSDIVELSTRITQTERDITLRATKTELTAVDTKATNAADAADGVSNNLANNYYTKTQADAKIKVEADKIESVVQKTNDHGTRLSKVEQTADGLTISLGQTKDAVEAAKDTADTAQQTADNAQSSVNNLTVGGRNLLPYAKFVNPKVISANSISHFGFIANGSNKNLEVFGQIDGLSLERGVDYTMSFTAWVNTTDNSFRQKITWDLWPDTLPQEFIYDMSNVPKRYSWVIRSNESDMSSCNVRFFTYEADSEGYFAKYPIYITDIKLEKGNKATDWTPAAEEYATNFLSYDSTNGLLVGNKSSGSWSGYRTQITSSAFNILDSSGNQVASYGANNIYLGKNNRSSVIDFCNGLATMKYSTSNFSAGAMELNSTNYGIKCTNGFYLDVVSGGNGGSLDVSTSSFYLGCWGSTSQSYIQGDSAGNLLIHGSAPIIADNQISISPATATDFKPFISTRKISSTTYRADFGVGNPATGVASAMMRVVNSSGTTLNHLHLCDTYLGISNGYIEAPSGFRMPNNTHLYSYTVGGALWSLVTLSVDDNVVIGWGSYNDSAASSRLYGNNVYLTSKSKVYSSVAVTVSSDRRIKEDVSEKYSKFDALLDHLKPVSYKLKTTNDGRKHLGLIAQDVEQAMKVAGLNSDDFSLVTRADVDPETDPDNLLDDGFCLGIAYEELIPILIHRVQRLTTEIEKLKGQRTNEE